MVGETGRRGRGRNNMWERCVRPFFKRKTQESKRGEPIKFPLPLLRLSRADFAFAAGHITQPIIFEQEERGRGALPRCLSSSLSFLSPRAFHQISKPVWRKWGGMCALGREEENYDPASPKERRGGYAYFLFPGWKLAENSKSKEAN